jgi:hypothetical protein
MMELIKYAMQEPLWVAKLSVVYLGHPIFFFLFLALVKDNGDENSKTIAGFKVMEHVSVNTDKIILPVYLAVTLTAYLAWLVLEVAVLQLFAGFEVELFLALQVSWWSLGFAIPGLLNLFVWTFGGGMEGNVFGFILSLPMLIASLAYAILWAVYLAKAFEHHDVNP